MLRLDGVRYIQRCGMALCTASVKWQCGHIVDVTIELCGETGMLI